MELKEIMEKENISEKKLASALGVAESTVSRWKNNIYKPNYDNQKKLNEYFSENPKLFNEKIIKNTDKSEFKINSLVNYISDMIKKNNDHYINIIENLQKRCNELSSQLKEQVESVYSLKNDILTLEYKNNELKEQKYNYISQIKDLEFKKKKSIFSFLKNK